MHDTNGNARPFPSRSRGRAAAARRWTPTLRHDQDSGRAAVRGSSSSSRTQKLAPRVIGVVVLAVAGHARRSVGLWMTVAPSASSSDAVGVMTALVDSSLSSGISNWNSSALSLSRRAAPSFGRAWPSCARRQSACRPSCPLRTSDRHLEFASLRCLRGDAATERTRIDRRILLKNDLLAFGRARP